VRRFLGVSSRSLQIGVGLVTMLFVLAATTLGVRLRVAGNPAGVYQVDAVFDQAGQGLQFGSDVKLHGIDVGRVKNVRLADGQAVVRMNIKKGQHIPVASTATIRPKTLFGEKFVDIDPGTVAQEEGGPFVRPDGVIAHTVGGFELEQVLTELYPILQAVNPADLATVLDTLAQAGEGRGAEINRTIQSFSVLADTTARHDADTAQFLASLADLSDTLAGAAPDIVDASKSLNQVLPDLNARGNQVAALLDQASRLSADLADLLDNNRAAIDTLVNRGGQTIGLLYDRRQQIGPLLTGLRQFFQVVATAGHIPFPPTTDCSATGPLTATCLAGVKFVLNADCPLGRENGCGKVMTPCPQPDLSAPNPCPVVPSPGAGQASSASANAARAAATGAGAGAKPLTATPSPGAPTAVPQALAPIVSTGAQAVIDLILQVARP
jgi:phospholipid/cholesterol/gamma-HCH transport system substrate-binding protein